MTTNLEGQKVERRQRYEKKGRKKVNQETRREGRRKEDNTVRKDKGRKEG